MICIDRPGDVYSLLLASTKIDSWMRFGYMNDQIIKIVHCFVQKKELPTLLSDFTFIASGQQTKIRSKLHPIDDVLVLLPVEWLGKKNVLLN